MKFKRRRGQALWTNGESWQTNSDAREKHRISENFDTKKIDEHCRMTKPCERDLRIAPRCRLRFGKRWRNWSPAFDCPFTNKVTEPAPYTRAAQTWLSGCLHANGSDHTLPCRRRTSAETPSFSSSLFCLRRFIPSSDFDSSNCSTFSSRRTRSAYIAGGSAMTCSNVTEAFTAAANVPVNWTACSMNSF